MTKEISNSDDIIDSRDICERILELEEVVSEGIGDDKGNDVRESANELKMLQDIVDEIDNYGGDKAEDGVALIRDSYFRDYAEELADDIGAIDRNAKWPVNCIDWEQAARELQMDYTSLEFDGVTYWYR